jgi:hypothetical protein
MGCGSRNLTRMMWQQAVATETSCVRKATNRSTAQNNTLGLAPRYFISGRPDSLPFVLTLAGRDYQCIVSGRLCRE